MISEMESASGTYRVRSIIMNNKVGFTGALIMEYFRKRSIHPEFSTPFSPDSKQRAERINKTFLDRARTMIDNENSENLKVLWADGLCTTNYIRNRIYYSSN